MSWTDNYFTVFITTFQMPFFIMISGYLFYNSTQRQSYKTLIQKKIGGALIPTLFWNSVIYVPVSMLALWQGWQTVSDVAKGYFPYLFEGLWYLWAYFLCSTILCVVNMITKSEKVRLICYVLIAVITHIGIGGFCHLDFMFPFFLIGYYLCMWQKKFSHKNINWVAFIPGLLFPVFYVLYRPEYSMYMLDTTFALSQAGYFLCAYFVRFSVGVTGCSFVCAILYFIWHYGEKHKIIRKIAFWGSKTMELYILHTFTISYLLRWIIDGLGLHEYFTQNTHLTNFIVAPIIVICMMALGLLLIRIINNIPLISKFAFGVKKKETGDK